MELRKGLPITEFEIGQVLTRLEAAIYTEEVKNETLGIVETKEKLRDTSYRGEPMKFLGIENNLIVMQPLDKAHKLIFGEDSLVELRPENGWDKGWGIWIDPKNLLK